MSALKAAVQEELARLEADGLLKPGASERFEMRWREVLDGWQLDVTSTGAIQNVCIQGTFAAASAIDLALAAAKRVRTCPECHATQGHWNWCVGRGYSQTGQHPDAPAPETERAPRPTAEPDYCCGGTCLRSECEYHRGLPKNEAAAPNGGLWAIEWDRDNNGNFCLLGGGPRPQSEAVIRKLAAERQKMFPQYRYRAARVPA